KFMDDSLDREKKNATVMCFIVTTNKLRHHHQLRALELAINLYKETRKDSFEILGIQEQYALALAQAKGIPQSEQFIKGLLPGIDNYLEPLKLAAFKTAQGLTPR